MVGRLSPRPGPTAALGAAGPRARRAPGAGPSTPPDPAPAAPAANVFPPWQDGRNNDATHRGLEFTVPQVDVLADFHGDLTAPKLVLFILAQQYFVRGIALSGLKG